MLHLWPSLFLLHSSSLSLCLLKCLYLPLSETGVSSDSAEEFTRMMTENQTQCPAPPGHGAQ